MKKYAKFLVALVSALVVIGAELPPDAPSWLTGLFAILGAVAVYLTPNEPAVPPSR